MDGKKVATNVGKLLVQGAAFVPLVLIYTLIFSALYDSLVIGGNPPNDIVLAFMILGIFALIFFVTGLVSVFVTELLWLRVHRRIGQIFAQGGAISVLLLALYDSMFFTVMGLAPDTNNYQTWTGQILGARTAVPLLLLAEVFLFGVVSRYVSGKYRKMLRGAGAWTHVEEPQPEADNPMGLRCPRCGGVQLVVATDRSAFCIDCRKGIPRERYTANA